MDAPPRSLALTTRADRNDLETETFVVTARTVSLRGREGGGTAELGGEISTALRASQGGGDKAYVLIEPASFAADGVRRLTPLERERLQGFPDDWTEGESDSARDRMTGNAVCVPVAEWIGKRLVAVNHRFFEEGE
jgi:DNA (cytosine-5)-methyltransferase 1